MIKTAVIVAAGLGSRLKGRTEMQPKGFLEVGGIPLIIRSIGQLREQGIEKIIIGTGYHSEFYEQLARESSDIVCVKSPVYRETSSFYTLYNLRSKVDDDFLLLESDLIYEPRALKELIEDKRDNLVLASGATASEDEVFIEAGPDGHILEMSKKRDALNKVSGELVGISKISREQFLKLCLLAEKDEMLLKKGDYESAIVSLSATSPFYMKKVEDLVWAEIDCEAHLERVIEKILPRIEGAVYEH